MSRKIRFSNSEMRDLRLTVLQRDVAASDSNSIWSSSSASQGVAIGCSSVYRRGWLPTMPLS